MPGFLFIQDRSACWVGTCDEAPRRPLNLAKFSLTPNACYSSSVLFHISSENPRFIAAIISCGFKSFHSLSALAGA